MARLDAYYRPESVSEALEILVRERGRAALLAGGTDLIARLDEGESAVIDLQAVGLDEIEAQGDRVILGAMTRLQALGANPEVPELLQSAALEEGPNTLRNAGTVGGVVVGADPESELLAAMLVCDGEVTIETQAGKKTLALPDFLADIQGALSGGLLTQVSVATGGQTAAERVARTPKDRAIVAVLGRKDQLGSVALAVCGVAETPVLVTAAQLGELTPPSDFRGSAGYRRRMAEVLGQRVLAALDAG